MYIVTVQPSERKGFGFEVNPAKSVQWWVVMCVELKRIKQEGK